MPRKSKALRESEKAIDYTEGKDDPWCILREKRRSGEWSYCEKKLRPQDRRFRSLSHAMHARGRAPTNLQVCVGCESAR